MNHVRSPNGGSGNQNGPNWHWQMQEQGIITVDNLPSHSQRPPTGPCQWKRELWTWGQRVRKARTNKEITDSGSIICCGVSLEAVAATAFMSFIRRRRPYIPRTLKGRNELRNTPCIRCAKIRSFCALASFSPAAALLEQSVNNHITWKMLFIMLRRTKRK
jgi:hypothetical protein